MATELALTTTSHATSAVGTSWHTGIAPLISAPSERSPSFRTPDRHSTITIRDRPPARTQNKRGWPSGHRMHAMVPLGSAASSAAPVWYSDCRTFLSRGAHTLMYSGRGGSILRQAVNSGRRTTRWIPLGSPLRQILVMQVRGRRCSSMFQGL